MQSIQLEVSDELDKEFVLLIMGNINKIYFSEIEKRYDSITKHNRLKVESWV